MPKNPACQYEWMSEVANQAQQDAEAVWRLFPEENCTTDDNHDGAFTLVIGTAGPPLMIPGTAALAAWEAAKLADEGSFYPGEFRLVRTADLTDEQRAAMIRANMEAQAAEVRADDTTGA
jgi:hypothetical protein